MCRRCFFLNVLDKSVTPPMLSQHGRSQALVKEKGCDRRGEPTLNLAILMEMNVWDLKALLSLLLLL